MAIRLDTDRVVTVFGGSGFLGRHVVQALARTGCRIRVAVRRPHLTGHLQPLGSVGQIHAVQANLRYPDSVQNACEGADAVVNLVGVLHEDGKQTFDAIQAEGARNVARAAAKAGAEALVHVSALGADQKSPAVYARTKAAGERSVLKAYPKAVILRPSIVFGPEDSFFNFFAAMARVLPVLPLIGGGGTRFQPVYVGDVARAALLGLEGHARTGKVYELGGPEVLTFKEILQRILRHTGRRRLLVPVPFWLAYIQARVLQLLPRPLLTVDQVRLLEQDNVVSPKARRERRTLEGLGVEPVAIDAVVPGYLWRFRARGQFAAYKS